MRRSLILDTVTRAALPTVLVFSLYLLFVGHNAPGGGFVGGLVAGAALVLRFLARGSRGLADLISVPFDYVLGAGLLIAGGTGAASWLFGGAFLSSADVHVHIPLLGDVHLVSPLAFDIGVYLVVVGLVLGVLTVLGAARVAESEASLAPDGADADAGGGERVSLDDVAAGGRGRASGTAGESSAS